MQMSLKILALWLILNPRHSTLAATISQSAGQCEIGVAAPKAGNFSKDLAIVAQRLLALRQ